MCDLAPRQGFDIARAILEANIITAGLFRPSRFVFAPTKAQVATTTPGESEAVNSSVQLHPSGVGGGEGEGR